MGTTNPIKSLFGVKRAPIGVISHARVAGTAGNKLDVAASASIALEEARISRATVTGERPK